MPPPDISALSPSLFLGLFLLLLALFTSPPGTRAMFADRQTDCQANEQFIECGSCEGSCNEPVVPKCRKECKPPRCECQSKNGFVRAHDGACIPLAECASYKGAYFGSEGQLLSQSGVLSQNGPKTVLDHFKPVGGGAGFSLQNNNNGNDGIGTGKGLEGNELQPVEAPPSSPLAPVPPSPQNALPVQQPPIGRVPSPPSIAPPSFHTQTPVPTFPDRVIPASRDSLPPVVAKHRDNANTGALAGQPQQKQSQMNLFADVADSKLGEEKLTDTSGGIGTEEEGEETAAKSMVPSVQPKVVPAAPASLPPARAQHNPSPSASQPRWHPPNPPSSPPIVRPAALTPVRLQPISPSHSQPPAYSLPQSGTKSAAPFPLRSAPSPASIPRFSPSNAQFSGQSHQKMPKFDAFGVGHSLTIQPLEGEDQAVLGGSPQQQQFAPSQLDPAPVLPLIPGQIAQQDEPMAAKCGTRACHNKAQSQSSGGGKRAFASEWNWRAGRRLKTKSQPYLYAYMNPPTDELEKASGVLNHSPSSSSSNQILRRQSPAQFEPMDVAAEEETEEGDSSAQKEREQQQIVGDEAQQHSQEHEHGQAATLISPLSANLRIYRQKVFAQRRRKRRRRR